MCVEGSYRTLEQMNVSRGMTQGHETRSSISQVEPKIRLHSFVCTHLKVAMLFI